MTAEEVLESLVQECREDHIGLWRIANAARFDLGAANPAETRSVSLHLIRRLLSQPGMRVGHPAPDGRGFIPWNVSAEEALCRIEDEWSALGRDPDIGEMAWLTIAD
jgi:hypothetical protein